MAKLDVDAPTILIDGKVHRRVLRKSQTYETSAGEVVVFTRFTRTAPTRTADA
jgi:hypothetical protein